MSCGWNGSRRWLLDAESKLTLAGEIVKLSKEVLAVQARRHALDRLGGRDFSLRGLGGRSRNESLSRSICAWSHGGLGVDRIERGLRAKAVELWESRGEGTWNSDRLEGLVRIGSAQTQLELCLCSTEQSLVDVGVVRIEGYVGTGGVREAFEDDGLALWDIEEVAKLALMLARSF